MQIRLTVLGPRSARPGRPGLPAPAQGAAVCAVDVLVTAPAGTALASVASGLAAAVAAAGSDIGSGAVTLYAAAERLDAQRCALGEPPLVDGAVLALNAPADPERYPGPPGWPDGPDLPGAAPDATVRLDVVAGPDAGGVHLLHGGQIRIGRSADADVPLDDPDVSRLHCAVTVGEDGRVTIADLGSTNGTAVDGTPIGSRPVPLPPEALLRIGESALRLRTPPGTARPEVAAAYLTAQPDGEGHLRVTPAGTPASAAAPARSDPAGSHATGLAGVPRARTTEEDSGGRYASAGSGQPGLADPRTGGGQAAHAQPPVDRDRQDTHLGHQVLPGRPGADRTTYGTGVSPGAGSRAPYPGDPYPGDPHPGDADPGRQSTGATAGVAGDPPGYPRGGEHGGSGSLTHDGRNDPGPAGATGESTDRPGRGWEGGAGPYQHPQSAGYDANADRPGETQVRRRGIGAWARRLAAGRAGGERTGTDDDWAASGDGPAQAAAEAAESHRRWPDPAAVLMTALGPGPRLWERAADHPDALTVRLGAADRVTADGGLLAAAPVTLSLRHAGSLGLAGPRARLAGLARSVVAQLAVLHSPTAMEIVLISADRDRRVEERLAEWSWLGWLPQLHPARGQDCRLLLAYDREQATARAAELARRLDEGRLGPGWVTASRPEVAAAAERHTGPYTVVVVDGDPGSAALRGTLSRLAVGGPAAGIHLVCLAQAPAASPASPLSASYEAGCAASPVFADCRVIALLSGDVATGLQVVHRGRDAPYPATAAPGADLPGAAGSSLAVPGVSAPGVTPVGGVATVDAVSLAWAERCARALAPLRPAADAAGGHPVAALPDASRLLDELGLARATPASLMARWAAAADEAPAGGRTLAVLGAGPRGPLAVDLAGDGPHLLVDGAPGSGKTELLRSLAASLAAAERPDRLGMVLVDGGGTERGEGLRMCTDLPHVSTYLAASDPVRMREFAQALSAELKRRAELLGQVDFTSWHREHPMSAGAGRLIAPRRGGEGEGPDVRTLPLRSRPEREGAAAEPSDGLPRLVVLVDDFDALVAPALGSPGRPAAGSVVRALEAVARDGARLGVHLIAASGRPERTADTAAVERAGLWITLESQSARAEAGDQSAAAGAQPASAVGGPTSDAVPGRGRLYRPEDDVTTPFQAGRVTGRIPRTATQRPTVVPLDWERMGDPPTRRPLRELGNGPTDLALLASALQRAAQSAGATTAPALV